MSKRNETIIEINEEDVTRAVNQILTTIVPLKIEQFTFCAALHVILDDLKNQGVEMEIMETENKSRWLN